MQTSAPKVYPTKLPGHDEDSDVAMETNNDDGFIWRDLSCIYLKYVLSDFDLRRIKSQASPRCST